MTKELQKLGRLKQRAEFLFVKDGAYAARSNVVVQTRKNEARGSAIHCGFTATKKIGNAVVRNRAKRRLREAARALLPALGQPGNDYVFIARRDTAKAQWPALMKDIEKALLRLQ